MCSMDVIIRIFAAVLVPLFFIGMIGSLLVVIATVTRDLGEIVSSDDESD
jgi:hypothetical protein